MGSLTDVAENALLNHLCSTAYTPVASLFVALCTADPTDTATTLAGVEVPNANAYARTAVTFSAAATRQVIQSGAVTFPLATGTWGGTPSTHWAIVTSGTHNGGTCLAHGAFTGSFSPVNGNTPTIPTTEIKVQFNASTGAGFGDYTVHKWLDLMFRNIAFTKPATYVGLSTGAALTDTVVAVSGLTEVTGTSYARVLVNITGGASPAWSVVTAGAAENVQAINFPSPGAGGWTQITSMFLVDSASGAGNVLGWDSANITDQTAQASDTVQFAAGALDLSIA
jgi:hypothetical protein